MPEQPRPPHRLPNADPDSPTVRLHASTATAEDHEEPKNPDLTITQVVAGSGAAATSAVVGSYFGASGTVAGAALGSVVSTIAGVAYQKSLNRTRETVKARIKLPGGRSVPVDEPVEVPAAHGAEPGDAGHARVVVTPAEAPPPRRRRTWVLTGLATLVFLIGLLAVTGVEVVRGAPLSGGETGTSVGRVIGGGAAAPAVPGDDQETTTTDAPDTSERTSEPDSDTAPTTGDAEPSPTEAPGERDVSPGSGGSSDGSGSGETSSPGGPSDTQEDTQRDGGARPTPQAPTTG